MKAHELNEKNLISTLDNLRRIGEKINHASDGGMFDSDGSLRLIAESTIQLFPKTAAVIYRIDPDSGEFDRSSRVFAANQSPIAPVLAIQSDRSDDFPRINGVGARAIQLRQPVISSVSEGLTVHPYHQARGVRSVVCYPLMVRDMVLGVLYVYLYEERTFSSEELVTLEIYVNHAAMAIFLARTEKSLQANLTEKEKELKQIQNATSLLFSRLNLNDTLNAILGMALELTGAHYGIFRLVDESKKYLVTRSFSGMDMHQPKTEALPINEESIMGRVALSREPILITDLAQGQFDSYYPLDAEIKMRSELAIPLVNSAGGLEGVLNLESPTPSAFDQHDLLLVQSLATIAVIALQEYRLLEFVVEISNLIFTESKTTTLTYLTRKTNQFIGSRLCEIWVCEQSGLRLESSSSSTAQKIGYLPAPALSMLNTQAQPLNTLPMADLLERYSQNKLVNVQNSLFLWVISPSLAPRLVVVCASARIAGQYSLANDWNIRVLNFIRSYIQTALQNDKRNDDLQLEQEQRMLAETFAAVGDVASNILHNVNNKVGLIPVKIQAMKERRENVLANDEYLTRNLADIEKFAGEALRTVSQNLSNLRPISIGPVDLAKELEFVTANYQHISGIRFELHCDKNLPKVMANEQSLKFIFSNLVENAIDAMHQDGRIEIKALPSDGSVQVSIHDSGPGISIELQEKIFDFSNNDPNRQKNLGFGLWWVKTILFRLGGSITLTSNPGEGTTFYLTFPVEEHDRAKT